MGALATAERATGCGDSDRDGRQAYDLAVQGLGWDPARVVVFGRSIGTGPAVRLAAQAPFPARPRARGHRRREHVYPSEYWARLHPAPPPETTAACWARLHPAPSTPIPLHARSTA